MRPPRWMVLLVLPLAACSASISSKPTVTPTETVTKTVVAPSPAASTRWPAAVPTKAPASPLSTILPDRQQEYMLRLEAIKPEVTSDELIALANGAKVCGEVANGRTDTQLIPYTASTFAVNGKPLTHEEARDVLAVVKQVLCPS